MVVEKPVKEGPIYQCKVSLKGIIPPIWRKIQVRSDISLYQFHLVLQTVMGWQNYHLYEFIINGARYADPSPDEWGEVEDARRVKLNQVINQVDSKFIYIYDFGDDWQHVIKVEKILPPDPAIRPAICLGGKRTCPPEDCGGPWGYMNLLEVLKDPAHEEHAQILEWLGGPFDPEAFDKEAINCALRQIR